MRKTLFILVLALSIPVISNAQTGERRSFDISTNLLDWASLGTANLDFGASVARNFSLHLSGQYNPWEIEPEKGSIHLIENNRWSASIGARYWPWYVFSGWWVSAKVRYLDFTEFGTLSGSAGFDGNALGAGLSAGYTLMLTKNLNMEFGAGVWGNKYFSRTLYDDPESYRSGAAGRDNAPYHMNDYARMVDLNLSIHWIF